MRKKTYLALSLASLLLASVVVVACSGSKPNCTAGQLNLTIELDENSNLADHVVIFTNTPPASVTIPNTPGDINDLHATLTWPSGYPANKLVDVHIQAFGGVTELGSVVQTIHLSAMCTSAFTSVDGDLLPPDLYSADGIDASD